MKNQIKYILDNDGRTADRYTIVFKDNTFFCGSHDPSHPQGIGWYGERFFASSCEERELTLNDLPKKFKAIASMYRPKRDTVRVWVWLPGGEVKLTLHKDKPVRYYRGEPDEEGYSYTQGEYIWDGEIIHWDDDSGGRDCDGNHSHYTYMVGHPDVLNEKGYPHWNKEKSEVYDQYAQMAGY